MRDNFDGFILMPYSPSLLNSSYTITAEIDVPDGGAEGMILTSGGRFAGNGFDG